MVWHIIRNKLIVLDLLHIVLVADLVVDHPLADEVDSQADEVEVDEVEEVGSFILIY